MSGLRKSAFLRAVIWLALVLVVAVAADLVEDLVFEIDEAAAVDGTIQAEAADEDLVPSSKRNGSTPLSPPVLLIHAVTAAGAMTSAVADLSWGHIRIHDPPSS